MDSGQHKQEKLLTHTGNQGCAEQNEKRRGRFMFMGKNQKLKGIQRMGRRGAERNPTYAGGWRVQPLWRATW